MKLYKDTSVIITFETIGNVLRKKREQDGHKPKHWDKFFDDNSRFSGIERAVTAMDTAIRTYINKKGYYKSREEALAGMTKIDSCLLLSTYKDGCLSFPCIAMQKIDGLRARWDGATLLSRGGKEIKGLEHITTQLPHGTQVDGELYVPDTTLEEIQSIVLGTRDKSEVVYCIFDEPSLSVPYEDRLKQLHDRGYSSPCLAVPYTMCNSQEEADSMYTSHLKDEWEGTVYRLPGDMYVPKRSTTAIKRKPFKEEEFKIDSWEYDKDGHLLFILRSSVGNFRVVPSWTDEQRRNTKYAQSLVPIPLDKAYATVRYQTKTARGIPKFGNVITIRVTKTDGQIIY